MKFGDEELMVMFAAGVTEAFDMVYERYRDRIYRFAVACLKHKEDAEDVVQEVFLSVARAAARYEPQGRFKAWLFQIAANRIRTSVQVRAKRAEYEQAEEASALAALVEHGVDVESTMVMRERLTSALAELPELQRLILLLKELEGFSAMEIAETLALTPENVRINLFRARRKLLQDQRPLEIGDSQ